MAKPVGSIALLAASAGMAYLSYTCFNSLAVIPKVHESGILIETSNYVASYISSEPPHAAFEQAVKQLEKFGEANPVYVSRIDSVIAQIDYYDLKGGDSTDVRLNDALRGFVASDISGLSNLESEQGKGWLTFGEIGGAGAALLALYYSGNTALEIARDAKSRQERRRNNKFRNEDNKYDNNLRS